jgi:hypothetical protein
MTFDENERGWTKAEFDEFDRLTMKESSLSQMERIEARLDLKHFVDLHGKAKCDAMWVIIQENDKARKGIK